MSVVYEWYVEIVATQESEIFAVGDVIEHTHFATFKEAKADAATPVDAFAAHQIVLVRGDDEKRSWAYLQDDGTIPKHFENANGCNCAVVPKRFHKEVLRNVWH